MRKTRLIKMAWTMLVLGGIPAFGWPGAVVVSDTNRFTCGSAPISCFDATTRTIFAPYHTSRTGFGEQKSVLALAIIPVDRPAEARSIVLLEKGVPKDGVTYSSLIDASAILCGGKVRVFFLADAERYLLLDYDPVAGTVGRVRPVMCRLNPGESPRPLDATALAAYLTARGITGFDLMKDRGEHLICSAKPAWDGAAFYGTVTSGLSQPVLFRCADRETFDFVGVVPALAKYECQVAALNGRIYALLRGATGADFFTSEDGGRTFTPAGRLGLAETRPQLMAYRGQVLIGYSRNGERPNRIREGRNNVHVLMGEGPDLAGYREVLHRIEPMGFVYYDFVDTGDGLSVIWSDSGRFPDRPVWGALQGKDRLLHARVCLERD